MHCSTPLRDLLARAVEGLERLPRRMRRATRPLVVDAGRRGLLLGLVGAVVLASCGDSDAAPGNRIRFGRVSSPGAQTLAPSAQWAVTGQPGTGFGTANPAAPTDPTRTTAKPWIQPLFVPYQTIGGDYVLCFDAGAKGGLSKVRVWMEGNFVDVTSPSFHQRTDVNGDTSKFMYGYAVTISHATWIALTATGGHAQIYAEAFPLDPTMQSRTVGPYVMRARPANKVYDVDIDWSPSLSDVTPTLDGNGVLVGRFNTLEKCIEYCHGNANRHHCRIRATENVSYYNVDISVSPTRPSTVESWLVVTHAPGVTVNLGGGNTTAFGPWTWSTQLICLRGSGITFWPNYGNINMPSTKFWWDGSQIHDSDEISLYQDTLALSSTGFINCPDIWWTDVITSKGLHSGWLLLGCRITGAGESCDYNYAVHDTIADGTDNTQMRTNSLSPAILISSPSAHTLEASGNTTNSARTITVKTSGGTVVGTFTSTGTVGNTGHTFADLKTWIEGLGVGITATVQSPYGVVRRLGMISSAEAGLANNQDLVPTATLPATTLKPGGTMFSAIFDVHGDAVQYTNKIFENLAIRFLRLTNTKNAQQFFMEGKDPDGAGPLQGGFWDTGVRNCVFYADVESAQIDCDWGGINQHVVFQYNTVANNPMSWAISSFTGDAYCSWDNNYHHQLGYVGTPSGTPPVNRCYIRQNGVPAQATNCVNGTGVAQSTYFVDPANKDYRPIANGALKFGSTYVGALLPDGSWNLQAA